MNLDLRVWLGDLEFSNYPFALAFGLDLGRPENVYEVMQTWLADGELVSSKRTSNRSMMVPVLIEGTDMQDLATNEATMIAECEKELNLLTIDPGDGFGPPTVFRVFRVQARQERQDAHEMALKRLYTLEVQALPAARSQDAVTVGAEFVADSVAIEDDCELTTGWSATGSPVSQHPITPVVDSVIFSTGTGSVRLDPTGFITPSFGQASTLMYVIKTGLSIDASGGGYFVVRLRPEWGLSSDESFAPIFNAYLTTSGGGREAVEPLIGMADSGGFLRLAFAVPDLSTITDFEFTVVQRLNTLSSLPAPKVWIDSIGLAGNSSANQNLMSFDVAGSMRCEGSFTVSAAAGLGDVLLYTVPDLGDGFRPDLRRLMATGTTTPDADAINGSRVTLAFASAPTFSAPASMFRAGSYAVLARVKRIVSAATVLTLDAQVESGVTLIGPVESCSSAEFTLADTDYHIVRVGVIELPPLVTDPASDATVSFTFSCAGSTDYYLDELLVFPLEDHALTWVACGDGAASATVASRFWIDEPSPARPRGARLVGNDEGRLDARYVLPESVGRHVLKPGRNLAYLLTSAAGGADLAAVYTPAWHSNAGQ